MVSISWLPWVFLLGGLAGMLMLALASMAARQEEGADRAEAAVRSAGRQLARDWRSDV
ncbi:MAG TPA: hypothetical protein VMN79_15180 [Casimicrobiaceae bacterium]|nr:hypothetical protein [Casimicrobiaceae bacterium]